MGSPPELTFVWATAGVLLSFGLLLTFKPQLCVDLYSYEPVNPTGMMWLRVLGIDLIFFSAAVKAGGAAADPAKLKEYCRVLSLIWFAAVAKWAVLGLTGSWTALTWLNVLFFGWLGIWGNSLC